MTRELAQQQSAGNKVMSRHSDPPFRPYRLTKVFVEEGKTPMCQIAALAPGQWLHLEAFDPVPKGKVWNALKSRWDDKAEEA